MVVGFTTTYAISADHGEVYNIMCYSLSVTCDRSVVFSWTFGFFRQL